ncbi:MAG: hypothetical protein QM594_04495 [Niabella sp.]
MLKQFFIVFGVLMAGYTTCQAQVPDTIAYLKSIEAEKSKYIGKTFDQMEKDLKIQIVYFGPLAMIHNNISKETSTRFYFIVPEYGDDFKSNYIEVYWDPYLDADKSRDIFRDAPDDSNWTAAAKAFYSKGVIKNIEAP